MHVEVNIYCHSRRMIATGKYREFIAAYCYECIGQVKMLKAVNE